MVKKIINVIIIGTNDFNDYDFFEEKLYEKLEKYFEEDYKIAIRIQEYLKLLKHFILTTKEIIL